MSRRPSIKTLEKLINVHQEARVYCKCGHSLTLLKTNMKICTWCGNLVFKTKKLEQEYRIKEAIYKQKRELKNI